MVEHQGLMQHKNLSKGKVPKEMSNTRIVYSDEPASNIVPIVPNEEIVFADDADVVCVSSDDPCFEVCRILNSHKPEGYRELRMLLRKSTLSETEESIVKELLFSYADYVQNGDKESELAANLVIDYLKLCKEE